MAVTRTSFLTRYPEFETGGAALIDVVLAEAITGIDEEVFGTKTDQAVMLQCAHLLAISPFGREARLSSKDGNTLYQDRLREITHARCAGYRVL